VRLISSRPSGSSTSSISPPERLIASRPVPKPPPSKRATGLQPVDPCVQQRVGHRDLADLGLQPGDLFIPGIPIVLLQGALGARERRIAPFRKPMRTDILVTRHHLQALAAKQPLNSLQFPLRRKAPHRAGYGAAAASVQGARRRRRSLRRASLRVVLSVHVLPPVDRKVALAPVS